MLATIIDTTALWRTVVAALVAGIGVTFIFSLVILGAARFADLSRSGRNATAVAFGTVSLLALAAFSAAIVGGILVMTSK